MCKMIDWDAIKQGAENTLFDKKYILYGTGSKASEFLVFLRDVGLSKMVLAVCDSEESKWGNSWNGYEVINPLRIDDYGKDILIIIASTFVKEIFEYIDKIGCKNNVISGCAFRLSVHYGIMNNSISYIDREKIRRYIQKFKVWEEVADKMIHERIISRETEIWKYNGSVVKTKI